MSYEASRKAIIGLHQYKNATLNKISLNIVFEINQIFFQIAGVTVMLSLTVFMNIVSELMPITSDAVPLIGK